MLGAHKEEENPRFSISPSSANDDPTRGEGTEGQEKERDRGNFLFSPLRMEIYRFIAGKIPELHVTPAPTLLSCPVLCETAKNNSWYMW